MSCGVLGAECLNVIANVDKILVRLLLELLHVLLDLLLGLLHVLLDLLLELLHVLLDLLPELLDLLHKSIALSKGRKIGKIS